MEINIPAIHLMIPVWFLYVLSITMIVVGVASVISVILDVYKLHLRDKLHKLKGEPKWKTH